MREMETDWFASRETKVPTKEENQDPVNRSMVCSVPDVDTSVPKTLPVSNPAGNCTSGPIHVAVEPVATKRKSDSRTCTTTSTSVAMVDGDADAAASEPLFSSQPSSQRPSDSKDEHKKLVSSKLKSDLTSCPGTTGAVSSSSVDDDLNLAVSESLLASKSVCKRRCESQAEQVEVLSKKRKAVSTTFPENKPLVASEKS